VGLAEEGDMADRLEVILGEREVDAFVDCVGFEAHACGSNHGKEAPACQSALSVTCTRSPPSGDCSNASAPP
jgi:glutathione-independent formaldehyde dehydrogenase